MDKVLLCKCLAFFLLSACQGMPGTKQDEEGFLMHNDEDHIAKDQYLRFKTALETEKPRAGPNDPETEHHGVLMHGDDVRGKIHVQHMQTSPEEKKNQEPKDPNEAMHELLHGEEGVHKHAWDEEKSDGMPGPPNEEQLMHGLLMHGDLMYGGHHDIDDTEKGGDVENTNSEPIPRTRGESEKDWNSEQSEGIPSPPNEEQLMHGLLMHGDLNHGDHHEQNEVKSMDKEPIGPLDAEEQLHGVLMHGDAEQGHRHDHVEEKTGETHSGRSGPDHESLHGLLMHGDMELGHDHSEEDKNAVHEVFRDLSKIMELGLDEDILRSVNIEELIERDKAEYSEYLANKPQQEDEAIMGSTYASVPDTILSDIELMKQKYLSKLDYDMDAEKAKAEIADKRNTEDSFTAYDVNSALGPETKAHENEDKHEHVMELIGSTEPINARHKMFQVLEENRKKAESKENQ